MACEHKRIQSVNCVVSCVDCGEILPIDYLVARERIAAQKQEETEQDAPKKTTRKRKSSDHVATPS